MKSAASKMALSSSETAALTSNRMGIDVTRLPVLAAEEDPSELRRKTVQHLQGYDRDGLELFLTVLGMLRVEMKKRYRAVDPLLVMNLGEIEKIAQNTLKAL